MKEKIKIILGVVIVIYAVGLIVTNTQDYEEIHCYHLGTWHQGMPLEGEFNKEDIIEYPCPSKDPDK